MKLSFRHFLLIVLPFFLFTTCSDDSNSPNEPAVGDGSIGSLSLSIDEIIVNSLATIQVKLSVPSNIEIQDSLVKLIRIDNSDNSTEIGFLVDNGDLDFGDEIIGDNIYSGIIEINESAAGTIDLMAMALATSSTGQINGVSDKAKLTVYSELTSEEYGDVVNTQESASEKLDEFLSGSVSNIESAVSQTIQWLQSQPQVASVESDGTTSLRINYQSGLEGGMIISLEDASGQISTKGGISIDDRKNRKSIPNIKQTVGTNFNYSSNIASTFKYSDLDDKLIGNRNVFIYAPYEAYFPVDMAPSIEAIIAKSDFEFSITKYVNQAANVAVLKTISEFGLIIFDTHGSGGKYLLTGEIADTNNAVYKDSYKALVKANKLAIFKNVTISSNGNVNRKEDIYAVTDKFFNDAFFSLNSVIFNGSCESNKTSDFSDAFLLSGANAYYGFDKVVNVTFCSQMADSVVKRLTVDLKNTAEAFISGQTDPQSPNAVYEYEEWIEPVHYPVELINGDFEFGKIDGWTKEGDGRVISKLVTQSPTGGSYMGIISTGLGFTTSTGKIFQSFRIENTQSTLTVKWNFLSEEFLEWINSSFQDFFKVVIKKKDGTEVELLSKSIDAIASDFGAQKFNGEEGEIPQPGNLVDVSPAIVFDQGGVYMTGWQTSSFDISAYRDEIISLILKATDVGDSRFDTAILLDDISIN
jgi:hypothetical protein